MFPIYETHFESEMKDSLETRDNPFEGNESIFLGTDSRATHRRKRETLDNYRKGIQRYRSKRFLDEDQEDPDIQKEIDRHGSDNVRIIK